MERKSRNKVKEDRAGFSGPAEPNAVPAGSASKDWGDDWVQELIAMTRPGIEMEIPPDVTTPRAPPFAFDDFD